MNSSPRRVWIIDSNEPWRTRAKEALDGSGLAVDLPDDFDDLAPSPDLVILGCFRPGDAEKEVLDYFVSRDVPVMVVASRLSAAEARNLFLAGATDAAARPGSSQRLQQLVAHSIAAISRRERLTEKPFTSRTL